MISSFTGDPFLARRAARAAILGAGLDPAGVTELGEGMSAQTVLELASQGGLFTQAALLLDFDAAFQGQAGVKPRNEVMKALESVGDGAVVFVLDPSATPARQKALQALGKQTHLALPRGDQLARWVGNELKATGVAFEPAVATYLAETFGDDAASIVSEIQKLAALDEKIGLERAKAVVNVMATHSAFDLIERVAKGDVAGSLSIARSLVEGGEAVPRVFGALTWQFMLVAKAAGLLERSGGKRVSGAQAAGELGAAPYAAEKALRLAAGLDEGAVRECLGGLLAADVAAKSGGSPELALEAAVIDLAQRWRGGLGARR